MSQPGPRPTVRLQKLLASSGLGSRRHCEQYIEEGRVTVDGETVSTLGVRVDPRRQEVRVDGEIVRAKPKRYYVLNKPQGFLCTNRDPEGRPRAVDLVPDHGEKLFTVGRLDENSQGLLLVTNDGELAERLAHPRYQVPRKYRIQVAGKPTREILAQLCRGVYFPEGRFKAQSVRRVGTKGDSTFLELVLTEGKNREVRRMLARLGHKVIHLERVGFGPLQLGRLGLGKHRPLTNSELKSLRAFAEGRAAKAPRRRRPARRK